MSLNMDVNIFILCYNESIMLPHTINHYRRNFPNSIITVLDNESTDNSLEIILSMGCEVATFSTNYELNEHKQTWLKDHFWMTVKNGWIIMVDMDEWLCATEEDLANELRDNTSILTTKGVDIIGESNELNLGDVDLNTINRVVDNKKEDKHVCFYRNDVEKMNYTLGAHYCSPQGNNIKYSSKTYYIKHMSNLGIPYLIQKINKNYERTHRMRMNYLICQEYTSDVEKITNNYKSLFDKSYILDSFESFYGKPRETQETHEIQEKTI